MTNRAIVLSASLASFFLSVDCQPQPSVPARTTGVSTLALGGGREPSVTWVGDHIERRIAQEELTRADRALRTFALANGFGAALATLRIDHVEIFDDKTTFDARLNAISGRPLDTKLPKTFVGVFSGGVLYACSERVAAGSNPLLRSRVDYEKLLTHELAHALHVNLLNGDEARMGPQWFYEGFAAHAAGQYPEEAPIDRERYLTVLASRAKPDYRLFAAAVRKLAHQVPLPELVSRAAQPGFSEWAATAVSFDADRSSPAPP